MYIGDNRVYSWACSLMIIHVSHACVKPKTAIEIIEITHKTSEQNYRF